MPHTLRFAAVFLTLLSFSAPALAADPPAAKPAKTPRSKAVDPALAPIEDVPNLPRVLLIGDSISMGYTLPVRDMLRGKANVHRPPANCGDSGRGLASLDKWLGDTKWDVIHYNFGLHDLKYLDRKGKYVTPDKGKQVNPLPQYEKNLRQLAARLKKTGAKVIWCSTTPVPAGSGGRVEGSEEAYNAVAAKVAAEYGIAIDDLHAVAKAKQATIQLPHNVHFTPDGYRILAKSVAASIEKTLAE